MHRLKSCTAAALQSAIRYAAVVCMLYELSSSCWEESGKIYTRLGGRDMQYHRQLC
jgi:glutamine amidotransferase-like uncharacterized protein